MLRVHFLNVGHGDCTIIKHPSGNLTVIDINNSQNYDPETMKEIVSEELQKTPRASLGLLAYIAAEARIKEVANSELTDPIEFLKAHYPNETPFRFILTHADLDHMRGIKKLYEHVGFTNFWDTRHTKPTPTFQSESDKENWEFYTNLREGKITGISPRFYTRGDRMFAFGTNSDGQPGGDRIEILSPTPSLAEASNIAQNWNNHSVVIKVSHGGWSCLLPGDAEDNAWEIMADHYGGDLKSNVLKASHHGRDSGFFLKAVQLISPDRTIVSVGKKPDTDASNKYRHHSKSVSSTRYHGNIEYQVQDDGSSRCFVDRNWD